MSDAPDPKSVRLTEAELADLFDNAAVGIHWVGADGTILRANRTELEMLGYTAEEYVGRHIAEFHADANAIEDILSRLHRGETIQNYEARLRCKDGSVKYVLISSNVLWEEGRFAHTRCFTRDMTERKLAEQAVRESEQRYRHMIEAAHEGIWQLDAEGRTVFANARMADMLGVSLEALRASSVTDFLDEAGRHEVLALRDRRKQGVSEHVELRFNRGDGSELWALLAAAPMFGPQGEYTGVLGMLSDVTERKRAEMALQEADRRKDEFLATLSHELRNPLAPLKNALQLLRAEKDPATIAKIREMMERQFNHLVRLVDDLLEVSRITRGAFELRKERVAIGTTIASAVETSCPLIDAARHALIVRMPDDALWVHGDPVRLAQIVANLLNNATKYTPAGGEITISAHREGDEAVLSVGDNGSGIAPEMLPRLFEMFTRGEDATSRSKGGLGIGLALARRLALMHGGSISAFSAGPGKGSAFTVRLPLLMETPTESALALRITPTALDARRVDS